MKTMQAYNDAASQAVFRAFEERLKPLLAEVAPDWLLHHMEIHRRGDVLMDDERVEIRLVITPIGSAKVVQNRLGMPTVKDQSC